MAFLVYCTDEYMYVSDNTLKTVFPDSEFNNEPFYESVKVFVINNVNNRDQARDTISLETGLQVIKVEELPNDQTY